VDSRPSPAIVPALSCRATAFLLAALAVLSTGCGAERAVQPEAIEIHPARSTVLPARSVELTLLLREPLRRDVVSWEAEDPSVISVEPSGASTAVVTARRPGRTIVRARLGRRMAQASVESFDPTRLGVYMLALIDGVPPPVYAYTDPWGRVFAYSRGTLELEADGSFQLSEWHELWPPAGSYSGIGFYSTGPFEAYGDSITLSGTGRGEFLQGGLQYWNTFGRRLYYRFHSPPVALRL
jgi:hypothetical protein